MAALQKIRSHGVLLVTVIAIALAFFVLGDLVRGGEGLFNQSKLQVGEVLGENLSYQDYTELYNNLQNYYEISGQSATGEDALNRIKDEAWQGYVQNQLIADECEKLGVVVTDEEVARVVQTGQHQMLQLPVFMDANGQYDYTAVQTFLTQYKQMKDAGNQVPDEYEKVYKLYLFAQHSIREQLLMARYQSLFTSSITSNNVTAKAAFEAGSTVADIVVAALPFSAVADDKVTASDKEIEAKYDEKKAELLQPVETRDIKYIAVTVEASEADKKASQEEMETAYNNLVAATSNEEAGNVARQATSLVPYTNILKSKDAFGTVIASELDSVNSGVHVPAYDAASNVYYTYRVLDSQLQADSVLFRQIGVFDADVTKAQERADSIVTALAGGANFKDIAQVYGQAGDSAWVATAHYERGTLDADNAQFISAIYSTGVGQTKQVKLTNGTIIVLQVLDAKNPIQKYNIAAVVKEGNFSDETYNDVYSKFSKFVAENKTLENIEANAAKSGYVLMPMQDVTSANHNIANVHGTHDALKWVFDEAKTNEVSQIYKCGDNDQLLVVALTGVNKAGYRPMDKVKEGLKQEVLNEKKAAQLLEKLQGAKTLADAQKQGAVVDSLSGVSFAQTPYVSATNSPEPVVAALAAKTAKGAVSAPAKGNGGVYMVQVVNKQKNAEAKFDAKVAKQQEANTNMRYAINSVINALYLKANVVDNRYRFF